jgi:hypothetical protein
MPPRPDPPKPPARQAREPVWVIATRDLFLGGQPGSGVMPARAHRAGDRVTRRAAVANGWLPYTRPE